MKKLALALLATSAIAAGANAATTEAQATMVFEGYVTSTVPTGALTITGIGGGALDKGALTVDQKGRVTTSKPVIFEVHHVKADHSVGDLIKTFNGRVINASMTAGSATVNNALGKVRVNTTELAGQSTSDQTFSVANKSQSTVEYSYAQGVGQTGLDLGLVGAGTAIQASVVVVVSNPSTP